MQSNNFEMCLDIEIVQDQASRHIQSPKYKMVESPAKSDSVFVFKKINYKKISL